MDRQTNIASHLIPVLFNPVSSKGNEPSLLSIVPLEPIHPRTIYKTLKPPVKKKTKKNVVPKKPFIKRKK